MTSGPPHPALRSFTEPRAVIIETVRTVAPDLDPTAVDHACKQVARSLRQQRQLAEALTADPGLLTSGRPQGPRLIELLIRALQCDTDGRSHRLVLPGCGICGEAKPLPLTDNDLRVCALCMQRKSRRPQPCGKCGRVLQVRHRDSLGHPRCYRCPPDADSPIDPLTRVCAHVHDLDPGLEPTVLARLVQRAVPQPFQLRELADALDGNPALLTGQGTSGSARLIALLEVLVEHQVHGIVMPICPLCRRTARLIFGWAGVRCCGVCYTLAIGKTCTRCRKHKPVARHTPAGEPVCPSCANLEPQVHEVCAGCGRQALIMIRDGDQGFCKSCRRWPVAVCYICGKSKPCHFASTDAPRCQLCSRRLLNSAECSRCGNTRPVHTRTNGGDPLCDNCSARREPCVRCSRIHRVVARTDEGPFCQRCYSKDPASFRPCRECGETGRLYHFGLCPRCACPHVLRSALTGADATMRPDLEPVFDTLIASDPSRVLAWVKFPAPRKILSALADGKGPVTHETLDQLRPEKAAKWLRAALVTAGVLPQRDEYLADFTRWSIAAVATITDPSDRKTVRSYVTWHHLRLLRQRSRIRPVTSGQMEGHRQDVRITMHLLTWLRDHNLQLGTCSQRDIDQWLADGATTRRFARSFLVWAVERGHAHGVVIPAHGGEYGGSTFIEDDHRWELVRRFLHNDALAPVDRVAGLLVLCYAQPASRIATITIDQIVQTADRVSLSIGDKPLHLPSPLDALVVDLVRNRRGQAVIGHNDDNPWLFPGALPGRHLSAARLGKRLQALGIKTRPGRNAALMDLSAQLPAAALAQLLGIHLITAAGWTQAAGNTSPSYAAEFSRRHDPGSATVT